MLGSAPAGREGQHAFSPVDREHLPETDGSGYRLVLEPEQLDLLMFRARPVARPAAGRCRFPATSPGCIGARR
jgi:hypothetical protein